MRWFRSLKEDRIKLQLEQEQLALDKSELAAREASVAKREQTVAKKESELVQKEAAVAERERNVAQQQYKLKVAEEREQEASKKIREAEELKRELERQKHALEQRWQSFPKEAEDIIARRVDADIKGYMVGINQNWKYLFRKEHRLMEYEHKILKQAQLIADHLGVPLRSILTPREKKLVDRSANELAGEHCALREEHYALIDLVMSCPEDQLKDLLASTQQFQRNLRR